MEKSQTTSRLRRQVSRDILRTHEDDHMTIISSITTKCNKLRQKHSEVASVQTTQPPTTKNCH